MYDFLTQQPLILASGSLARQQLLQSLGLQFMVVPSGCDENSVKAQFKNSSFIDLAKALACEKAILVSEKNPDHFVIAADQLCVIGDQVLDKPETHAIATEHLRLLRGKTHQQIAAVCIAKAGKLIWENQEVARLTMNNLSDKTIEAYLQLDQPYQSCGAYNYEGKAKWLFRTVEGSDCTILGLPLIPLIQAFLELDIVSLA